MHGIRTPMPLIVLAILAESVFAQSVADSDTAQLIEQLGSRRAPLVILRSQPPQRRCWRARKSTVADDGGVWILTVDLGFAIFALLDSR